MDSKNILITGGSGGMGRAIAKRFLESGFRVYITDINKERAAEVVNELKAFGDISFERFDVSNVSDCEAMVEWASEETGGLDILVNAAGVWVEGDSAAMTEEMWDRTININLKGTFFTCRYAIPELIKKEGNIVNISSDAGLVGNNGAAIYCASKGGVVLLTKALALELAPFGVRVNAVCPGDVDTPMIQFQAKEYGKDDPEAYMHGLLEHYPQKELARFTTPEEIAETVFFLSASKVKAITGAAISVDFGVTSGY